MRLSLMLTALVATVSLGGAALAQDAASEGEYRPALERMITASAQGVCPADVMAEPLLVACNQQIEQIAPALASFGPIVSITFVQAEGEGAGRVEAYAVLFEGGQLLTWVIGGYSEGKFSIAYVGG